MCALYEYMYIHGPTFKDVGPYDHYRVVHNFIALFDDVRPTFLNKVNRDLVGSAT